MPPRLAWALCGALAAADCGGPEAVCGSGLLQRAQPARHKVALLEGLEGSLEKKGAAVDRLQARLESFGRHMGYSQEEDIYVTMADHYYSRYFTPWSKRMKAVGLKQQLIVALDDGARDVARQEELPAVDADLLPVWEKGKDRGNTDEVALPRGLATLKFLVPKLLLTAGYERVIFTETDVYFFQNPSAHYPPADVGYGSFKDLYSETSNIGFMVFTGKSSLPLLDSYLKEWAGREKGYVWWTEDQKAFNSLLQNHTEVTSVFLCSEKFALGPAQVRQNTLVAHVTIATPQCKEFLLKELYENYPTQKEFIATYWAAVEWFGKHVKTPKWMDWMDC